MTYTIYDQSANKGSPYELFKFVCDTGNFYYTNNNESVSFEGNTYKPEQIVRGVTEVNALTTSPVTVTFTVPTTTELFAKHGKSFSPPNMLVEVYRFHRGTTGYRKRVAGRVVDHTASGVEYSLSTKNIVQVGLAKKVAAVTYINQCNNVVYDKRCKANKTANTAYSVVTSVLPNRIDLSNSVFPDGELKFGVITIGAEERYILDNTGNSIHISYPFMLANVGQTATLLRMCDYSRDMCIERFDNIANYVGFPTIPVENPALPNFNLVNTSINNVKNDDEKSIIGAAFPSNLYR